MHNALNLDRLMDLGAVLPCALLRLLPCRSNGGCNGRR